MRRKLPLTPPLFHPPPPPYSPSRANVKSICPRTRLPSPTAVATSRKKVVATAVARAAAAARGAAAAAARRISDAVVLRHRLRPHPRLRTTLPTERRKREKITTRAARRRKIRLEDRSPLRAIKRIRREDPSLEPETERDNLYKRITLNPLVILLARRHSGLFNFLIIRRENHSSFCFIPPLRLEVWHTPPFLVWNLAPLALPYPPSLVSPDL